MSETIHQNNTKNGLLSYRRDITLPVQYVCTNVAGKSNQEKATSGTAETDAPPAKKLAPWLRNKIIAAMMQVDDSTIAGGCIKYFAKTSDTRSNAEIIKAVQDMQEQMNNGGNILRLTLGRQYQFFKTLKF